MKLALLPLLLFAQDAAAVETDDVEEVVITARVGRVALIFDKAADGRLINCRVFKSSGVASIDREACTTLPDCLTDNAGKEYCGTRPGAVAPISIDPKARPTATPDMGLGKLIEPEKPRTPEVGPAVGVKAEEDPHRLGKLPPPPRDESGGGPAITFSGAQPVEDKPR